MLLECSAINQLNSRAESLIVGALDFSQAFAPNLSC
jgi:hypothetical protein